MTRATVAGQLWNNSLRAELPNGSASPKTPLNTQQVCQPADSKL
jgi:hypothetical protein